MRADLWDTTRLPGICFAKATADARTPPLPPSRFYLFAEYEASPLIATRADYSAISELLRDFMPILRTAC